jgi:gas vesicle protein
MKRFVIGMLIVGSVVAALVLITRKRSGDGDDLGRFAEDTLDRASTAASKVSATAKDAASKVTDTAKDAASKVSDTAKDAASKVTDTANNA